MERGDGQALVVVVATATALLAQARAHPPEGSREGQPVEDHVTYFREEGTLRDAILWPHDSPLSILNTLTRSNAWTTWPESWYEGYLSPETQRMQIAEQLVRLVKTVYTADTGPLTDEEFAEAIGLLKELNLEPWGLANGLEHAEKLGVASRVVRYNYGAIEGEPSFPMTNFGGNLAYEAGSTPGPRGVMGNAQTHCDDA